MFKLSTKSLEKMNLRKSFRSDKAGAFASFEGWVRNHNDGKRVKALYYEAQDILCQREIKKIFAESKKKFNLIDVRCFHRTGKLQVGDMVVWIGVLAGHRDAAFQGCRYIIDELKKRLPIWKKEIYTTGQSEWVAAGSIKQK
jgi:molybdopterin synthase catalytic subunit